MNESTGIRQLIRYLRRCPEVEFTSELAALPGTAWPELLRLAAEQGVAPLLFTRIRGLDLLPLLPADLQAALIGMYGANAVKNRRLLRETAAALEALEEAGIPVIVLKGVHLAVGVYGDFALRQMRDIDLLVPPELANRAESVLHAIGYQSAHSSWSDDPMAHHLPRLLRDRCAPIELHRGLTQRFGELRPDQTGLWERARPIAIGGVHALALSPEDLVLHLSLHVSHGHAFQVPIRSFYDIAAVLERHSDELDWNRLTALANRERSSRYVYSTLRIVERLFAVPVPDAEVERLAHDEADREVVELAIRYIEDGAPAMPLVYRKLVDGPGWATRFRLLRQRLFSGPGDSPRRRFARRRSAGLLTRSRGMARDLLEGGPRLRRVWKREQQRRRIRRWQRAVRLP